MPQIRGHIGKDEKKVGHFDDSPAVLEFVSTQPPREAREFLAELGNGDRRLLKDVLIALGKLDEGGFGECERCGEDIAEKRLEALPFARYCIECQRAVEEEERTAAR